MLLYRWRLQSDWSTQDCSLAPAGKGAILTNNTASFERSMQTTLAEIYSVAVLNDTYHVAEHMQSMATFLETKELLENTQLPVSAMPYPAIPEPTRWSLLLLATYNLLVNNFPLYAETKLQTNC